MTCEQELVAGCDISLNHGAIVFIKTSTAAAAEYEFFTDKMKYAGKFGGACILPPKVLDRDQKAVYRLSQIREWLDEKLPPLQTLGRLRVAATEGYAFSQTQQAHQLGEVGGVVRLHLYSLVPYRIHDPATVKLYATGKGNATKDEMRDAVLRQWNFPTEAARNSLEPRVLEDLADAYTLARMALTELQLRSGEVELKQLFEHQIRAFNRVTKANPVNLLVRGWI